MRGSQVASQPATRVAANAAVAGKTQAQASLALCKCMRWQIQCSLSRSRRLADFQSVSFASSAGTSQRSVGVSAAGPQVARLLVRAEDESPGAVSSALSDPSRRWGGRTEAGIRQPRQPHRPAFMDRSTRPCPIEAADKNSRLAHNSQACENRLSCVSPKTAKPRERRGAEVEDGGSTSTTGGNSRTPDPAVAPAPPPCSIAAMPTPIPQPDPPRQADRRKGGGAGEQRRRKHLGV